MSKPQQKATPNTPAAPKDQLYIVTPGAPVQDETPESPKEGNDLKTLFQNYATADAAVTAAKTALEVAIEKRSGCVAAIKGQHGQGPFRFGGDVLTAVSRGEKHFFRGKSTPDIIDVG